MSGVVGVFALGGSRVPCEPRIQEMASVITQKSDFTLSFSDHRLRLEAVMDPSLEQSSFQCDESGCFTWLLGYFDNKPQLVSSIASAGAEPNNAAELLTRLYQCKGLLTIPMLRGAFVAVIWDPTEHRLVMVRDPLGLRTLYFSKDSDHLWFATSPKALGLEYSPLDLTALHQLLLIGSIGQGKTLSQKIETLKPGALMVAERGQLVQRPYWQFLFENSSAELSPQTCQLQLSQSIDFGLARLGKKEIFLQGAQDNRSVLGLLFNIQSRQPFHSSREYEESHSFRTLAHAWGQPFGRLADVYQAMLLTQMEQGQGLVLKSGQNILFGYHRSYRDLRWHQRYCGKNADQAANRLSAVRPFLSELGSTKQYISNDFLAEIESEAFDLNLEALPEWSDWSPIGRLQASLVQWQLQPSLSQLARLSLDVGVTLEHPFLDMNFVESLLACCPDQHLCGVVGGQLLEKAFAATRQDFFCDSERQVYSRSLSRSGLESMAGCSFGLSHNILPQSWGNILSQCIDILQEDTTFFLFKKSAVDQLLIRCKAKGCGAHASDLRSLVFLASFRIWYLTPTM